MVHIHLMKLLMPFQRTQALPYDTHHRSSMSVNAYHVYTVACYFCCLLNTQREKTQRKSMYWVASLVSSFQHVKQLAMQLFLPKGCDSYFEVNYIIFFLNMQFAYPYFISIILSDIGQHKNFHRQDC